MSKVILICGKICSGKSTYTEKLKKKNKAVLLSCDEITLDVLGGNLGDDHDIISERTQNYFFNKSLEILDAGADVILDWGFWLKSKRDSAREFYSNRSIPYEFHYIDISDELWKINVAERNKAVINGETSAYFIDEGLAEKCGRLFEEPSADEIDVWYKNERK